MPKHKKTDAKPTESEFLPARLEQAGEAAKELNAMQLTAQKNTRDLAEQLNYQGSLQPDVLEDGITESQSRVSFELFAIGARLLLLKEQCPYGEFADRCARLGLEGSVARRLMQATLKFGNRATSHDFQKLGKSKLFELVVLDEEEIVELSDGQTVRGISLDEIECMSVSELRKKLRVTLDDAAANDRVLADKSTEITRLQRELSKQKVAKTDWPEQFTGYIQQVQEAERAIKSKLGALDIVRGDAMRIEPAEGEEAALEQARAMLAEALVDIHNRCAEYLSAIGLSFDKTLGAYTEQRIRLLPGA